MNYAKLEAEFLAERDWRVKELTILRTLPLKRTLTIKQREVVKKFAIPNIYSNWEGFVKFAFRTYINELNSLCLESSKIHNNLLTHSLDIKYSQFTTGVTNEFSRKCLFITDIVNFINSPVTIEAKLPTESNIKLSVINNILERFNLVVLPDTPYRTQLNSLLHMRNTVAHGDNGIAITQPMIDDNVNNVIGLMDEIMFRILDGCNLMTYKNTP